MPNYYKIERTDEGTKVSQIVDGCLFVTIVPSTVLIIIKEGKDIEGGEQ